MTVKIPLSFTSRNPGMTVNRDTFYILDKKQSEGKHAFTEDNYELAKRCWREGVTAAEELEPKTQEQENDRQKKHTLFLLNLMYVSIKLEEYPECIEFAVRIKRKHLQLLGTDQIGKYFLRLAECLIGMGERAQLKALIKLLDDKKMPLSDLYTKTMSLLPKDRCTIEKEKKVVEEKQKSKGELMVNDPLFQSLWRDKLPKKYGKLEEREDDEISNEKPTPDHDSKREDNGSKEASEDATARKDDSTSTASGKDDPLTAGSETKEKTGDKIHPYVAEAIYEKALEDLEKQKKASRNVQSGKVEDLEQNKENESQILSQDENSKQVAVSQGEFSTEVTVSDVFDSARTSLFRNLLRKRTQKPRPSFFKGIFAA